MNQILPKSVAFGSILQDRDDTQIMVVGNMKGDLKVYAHMPAEGSSDTPWKTAKINGQISVIKIVPYNNKLLGKALGNANYSAMTNILEDGPDETNHNCIIVLTTEGTLSIFNLQSLVDDYKLHVEKIQKTPNKTELLKKMS